MLFILHFTFNNILRKNCIFRIFRKKNCISHIKLDKPVYGDMMLVTLCDKKVKTKLSYTVVRQKKCLLFCYTIKAMYFLLRKIVNTFSA